MTKSFNDYGIKACASGLDLHGGGDGRRCEWLCCLQFFDSQNTLTVQLGNFRENIQRVLSSKSLYSWLFFFFFCELCQLDLPQFVFLCTNLKFPVGSRRLSGSHHITMLLETKCLPLQPHTIRTQTGAFLWKNCCNLQFFSSGDELVLVTVGAGKLKRAALRFHAGINPLPWLSVFSARLCCCLCVCLCPSVQRPREPFLFSGFISLKRWLQGSELKSWL